MGGPVRSAPSPIVDLLGRSEAIATVRSRLATVAPTPLPVLLRGETGTGKEVAARLLHAGSGRLGPFVAVDCAALAPTLVESELFGHERGAFTGASGRRDGLVAAARGGTFFLDEVGELPMEAQTRLLRLLEGGTWRPVGSTSERKADLRIVAATWRDLRVRVREGRFRADLLHRLGVVEIELPPLRERRGDIEYLLDEFLTAGVDGTDRPLPRLAPAARRHLLSWPWPGNVRELKNVASWLVAVARDAPLELVDLPERLRSPAPRTPGPWVPELRLDLDYMEARRLFLDEFQVRYVIAQLEAHGGNVSEAARAAGMDRRSIQRILARRRERVAAEGE